VGTGGCGKRGRGCENRFGSIRADSVLVDRRGGGPLPQSFRFRLTCDMCLVDGRGAIGHQQRFAHWADFPTSHGPRIPSNTTQQLPRGRDGRGKNIDDSWSNLWAQSPSRCIGLALLCDLVGLMPPVLVPRLGLWQFSEVLGIASWMSGCRSLGSAGRTALSHSPSRRATEP
jgi:hypothetical protein